jgi:PhnB protein
VHLYVEDTDALVNRAVAAGAKVSLPPTDMFWGDRFGKVTDPFGHEWTVATHQHDYTPEEMQRKSAEFFATMQYKK